MSKVILYPENATDADTLGVGTLHDAIGCVVKEELDGIFELTMQYPVGGVLYDEIKERMLIGAIPGHGRGRQLFRIYQITQPIGGIITIYASHISYDLHGIPCDPFTAIGSKDAMVKLAGACTEDHPFIFETDKDIAGELNNRYPKSARSAIVGESGSILSRYKGDLLFDNCRVSLLKQRGSDRGYHIRYGVNLIDFEQEKNCQETYTGVYPYWYDEQSGKCVSLPEKTLYVEHPMGFVRVLTKNFTEYFDAEPTIEQLRNRCRQYIEDNDIGKIRVSIDVRFADLRQYEEYKEASWIERVELGDTVHVDFALYGVATSSRVTATEYDALMDEYEKLHIGIIRKTFTDTVTAVEKAVKEAADGVGSTKRGQEQIADEVSEINNWIGDENDGAIRVLAEIQQETTDNSARIGLIVEKDDDGNNVVRGSIIIEAINDESSAKIQADRIVLDGYVTVKGLSGGTTTIDGACIKTGTIEAERIDVSGVIQAAEADIQKIAADTINVDTLLANYVTVGSLKDGTTTIDGACIKSGYIQSTDYAADEYGNVISGMRISLDTGYISSKDFKVGTGGGVYCSNLRTYNAINAEGGIRLYQGDHAYSLRVNPDTLAVTATQDW